MSLPDPESDKRRFFGRKRILLVSLSLILTVSSGLIFSKRIEKAGYALLGKIFPGSHVKVEGIEVKGFVDGKKINNFVGIVKAIEPSTSGTRLTIEWEKDRRIVLVDPTAPIYSGQKTAPKESGKSSLEKENIKEVKVDDLVLLSSLEKLPNGELKSGFVIVLR